MCFHWFIALTVINCVTAQRKIRCGSKPYCNGNSIWVALFFSSHWWRGLFPHLNLCRLTVDHGKRNKSMVNAIIWVDHLNAINLIWVHYGKRNKSMVTHLVCVSWLLRGLTDNFFPPFSRNSIWVVHPFVGFFCLHSVARIFSQLRQWAPWNYCLSFLKVRKSKFCVFFENLRNVQNGPTYSSPFLKNQKVIW